MTSFAVGSLLLLGVFHGINPAMGWLFAVSIGLQERSRWALLAALPAIALGHEASVALFAVAITVTGSVVSSHVLLLGGGCALVAFGMWRLLSQRHFRWAGMRLSRWQLASWSFLMSSMHGAGLMLLPVLSSHGGTHVGPLPTGDGMWAAVAVGLAAAAVHTTAMVLTAGAVALLVHGVLGLTVLRSAWIDLDRVWAVALVGAGVAAVSIG